MKSGKREWFLILVWFSLGFHCFVAAAADNTKKALIIGRGEPFREADGSPTHPQMAKTLFLRLVGNPNNEPGKGWTAELSWDLMVKLGMNPTNTPVETLLKYIGEHQLGYRIAIGNLARGQTWSFWDVALDNGMMPFAPQGNNQPGYRWEDPPGLRPAVSVAGGTAANQTSYGPGIEFIDALPLQLSHANFEDAAQSWANQVVAAKFARVLDTHPSYNLYDARQYQRQSASEWRSGWTEKNGYGRIDPNASVSKLLPAPPLAFNVSVTRDHHHVLFTWRNFLQSDFAATVIARRDGRVIYDGSGTNFTWTSDIDGEETFTYWSKNRAGEKSRLESYQNRKVGGLSTRAKFASLVLGAPRGDEPLTEKLRQQFQALAANWNCDVVYRAGNPQYDSWTSFPRGPVVGILPDFAAMVSYAISNHYQMLLVPSTYAENDLYRFKKEWDRAAAAGILVVMPHNASSATSRKPEARRLIPPRLFSAITVGAGTNRNLCSFGPGLEVFDAPNILAANTQLSPIEAVPVVAAKLGKILEANSSYNAWDARQHLRQSSSLYASGWIEDGGFGRPAGSVVQLPSLDPAPPLDLQALKSADGKSVTFSWLNFLQTSFAETVIQRQDGRVVYEGTDTSFVWNSDLAGEETFKVFTKDKAGRLSRSETFTIVKVTGLAH